MRISRHMAVYGQDALMTPESVTINSGSRTQYWSGSSNDWHNTSTNPGGVPFTNYPAYWGRNSNGVYHQLALCFKTSNFRGKSKNFTCQIRSTSKWGWTSGLDSMWQLSKHDWDTAEAWQGGSKSYYSQQLSTTAPNDPNAVANGTFLVDNTDGYWIEFNGAAVMQPNTQYVFYIWAAGAATVGKLIEVAATGSAQPVITLTR